MSDQDIRMTEGFGIDPIMKKRLDSQEINSVVELLKEFWKTKSCPAYIYYDNPRAYIPRVQKTKDFIKKFCYILTTILPCDTLIMLGIY